MNARGLGRVSARLEDSPANWPSRTPWRITVSCHLGRSRYHSVATASRVVADDAHLELEEPPLCKRRKGRVVPPTRPPLAKSSGELNAPMLVFVEGERRDADDNAPRADGPLGGLAGPERVTPSSGDLPARMAFAVLVRDVVEVLDVPEVELLTAVRFNA